MRARRGFPGLPWWLMIGLALLAVPRAVLHDAGTPPGPVLAALVTFGPPVVWVVVAHLRRIAAPLLTLTTVGVLYGVLLALVHNLMWDRAYDGDPPRLGGNLEGELSAGAEEVVMRVAAGLSSVFTGAVVGLLAGLVAMLLLRARR